MKTKFILNEAYILILLMIILFQSLECGSEFIKTATYIMIILRLILVSYKIFKKDF